MIATEDLDASDWDQDAESGKLLSEVGIGHLSLEQGHGAKDTAADWAGAGGHAASRAQITMCGLFSLDFYRPYFDVDTVEVKKRLLQAAWPKRTGPPFLSDADGAGAMPDLYGPVWVSATLVFVLSVVSNAKNGASPGDFDKIFRSVYFVMDYLLVGTLGLWGFFRAQNIALSGPEALSVYGYSLTPFVIAAPLRLLGWPFRWLALAGASICAALFVLRSSWPRLQEVESLWPPSLQDVSPEKKSTMFLLLGVSVYHFCWFILLAMCW